MNIREYNSELKLPTEPLVGEIAQINLNVKVVFDWSDQIVDEVDDYGNITSYRSGWVMKVLPDTLVWNNEDYCSLGFGYKEK